MLGTLIIVGSALWVIVTKKNQNRKSLPIKGVVGVDLPEDEGGEEEILLKTVEEAIGRESASNSDHDVFEVVVQNETAGLED